MLQSEERADPLRDKLEQAIGFQYRIERLLGRGGMGAVYLAHELALDRDVAIKVLPPEQASSPELRERFKREARTAARLTHPNIVPLHTFGEVSGLMYFVMGYVAGESLAGRLRRIGPFDSESARTLLASMCDALDYAHRHGIVHRDIKPDNILIDSGTGEPLLTDFGIAKAVASDAQLTTDGQLMGTPYYMSPEQAMGKADVDLRSDLYSLGVVAYEMVSAKRPFEGKTAMEALTQRLTREPKPVTSIIGSLPPDLAHAIGRCLQRDPADRWPDARSLREILFPSEEETENTFEERLLRVSMSALVIAVVASGYAVLYGTLHPGNRSIGGLAAAVVGAVGPLVLAAIVATIRIRAQGRDLFGVFRMALQQPTWWRGWYPRALRRRADMWDRLPRELRLFRAYRGVCLMYVFAVFVPLQLMTAFEATLAPLRQTLFAVTFALIVGMFAARRRAIVRVKSLFGANDLDASRLLNTASWRTTVWRRMPAPRSEQAAAAPAGMATAVVAPDETATRVSVKSG